VPWKHLLYKFEPAVSRRTLLVTAAVVWLAAGLMLGARAAVWLAQTGSVAVALAWAIPALLSGWAKGRWVLTPLASRNIARIQALSPHKSRICLFAFQAVQSYLLVLGMVSAGLLLRLSPLPRPILAALYLAAGTALVTASFRYRRM